MDHAAYHVVYVDSRLSQGLDGQHIQRSSRVTPDSANRRTEECDTDSFKAIIGEIDEVRTNLKRLLTQFNGVYTCSCEKTCMANLRRLDNAGPSPNPTLVLSGTTFETERHSHRDDLTHTSTPATSLKDPDGLLLLQHLSHEVLKANLSNLVIPVALIHPPKKDTIHQGPFSKTNQIRPSSGGMSPVTRKDNSTATMPSRSAWNHQQALRCMDAGALDVLESPLQEARIQSLIFRAYRAHKDALHERALAFEKKRSRKLSWLGNTENKPYAYLREKMVSDLMTGICNPDEHFHLGNAKPLPALEPSRQSQMQESLGSWSYWGHEFSEDELIHAAKFMLEHVLAIPGLEKWQTSTEKLTSFLMASRAAYNDFVEYHNFRHVIDVMQATFYFLIRLGVIPTYPVALKSDPTLPEQSPLASLLRPVDALTMLITAIGHDVGHPGVNNAFLVALNAPLAQLYNDRSVLEAFHCAAFSQILRRYWGAAFEDAEIRSLMINSILATDMGVHQKYMTDLGNLQDKWQHDPSLDLFNAQQLDDFRVLICALLIKCADISNVARPYDVAVRWANILQDEFANQGVMEREVGIPTTLFGGPPELGNLIKLGNSQKSFMNFFAQPLFESVASVLPAMSFTVVELQRNQDTWAKRIQAENERMAGRRGQRPSTGTLSPRTRSTERHGSQPELSLSEGLPASNPSNEALQTLHMSQSNEKTRTQGFASSQRASEPNLLSASPNERPNDNITPLRPANAGFETTSDMSRRSSGAFPSASNSKTVLAPRRTSNSSPSQLQLALDSRRHSSTGMGSSENRTPNDRASEDTLSQMNFVDGTPYLADKVQGAKLGASQHSISRNGNADIGNSSSSVNTSIEGDGPYKSAAHNRSSSGAHTNTTNASQSMPYSPTDTQATSVITSDSESRSAHAPADNLPDRFKSSNILDAPPTAHLTNPVIHNQNNPPLNGQQFAKLPSANQSHAHGGLDCGPRSIGRKASKFNIFSTWREKRRHRPESGS